MLVEQLLYVYNFFIPKTISKLYGVLRVLCDRSFCVSFFLANPSYEGYRY